MKVSVPYGEPMRGSQLVDLPPLRFHHLKEVGLKSGAHYLDLVQRQARGQDSEQTPSLEKGTALHHLIFGTCRVVYYPGAVRRGKEWEAFQEAHSEDQILTKTDYDKTHRMAQSIYRHERARELLLDGSKIYEKQLRWTMLGRTCRITPDSVPADYSYLVDLKTTQSSEPFLFGKQAHRYHYVTALDYYRTGIRSLNLGPVNDCYLVAVENTAPYTVTVFHATEKALERGHRIWWGWFEKLRGYEALGTFPGYAFNDVDLDAPDDVELTGFDDDEEAPVDSSAA